jgi:DNA mismatch repair protein MutS
VSRDVPFHSILFDEDRDPATVDERHEPSFFVDLNLDQAIEAITADREEYHLEPFFYTPLDSVSSVTYRHEIFRDLDGTPLLEHVRSFARAMRSMRDQLAQIKKLRHVYQRESWFLDAAATYCDAVTRLSGDLGDTALTSRGLLAFREYLTRYVESTAFTPLVADAAEVKRALGQLAYCVHIKGNRVQVSKYDVQADYSAEVVRTFEKFKQGAVEEYRAKFSSPPDMNHVEAQILDRVAQLYPDAFADLDKFYEDHRDYLDRTVADFDREVQFYVAYLEHVATLRPAGLAFCYPRVSKGSKEVSAAETFDLALANRLVRETDPVVCNQFYLRDPERVLVVTGPNQGGKTTFARTFGQLHYLASLGCLVPGTEAKLFLFDRLFTHFEKEEDLDGLHGKLEDDLVRVHTILEQATSNSIIILNEILTSTTLKDALFLGTKVLEQLIELDVLGVCVTFVDELASLGDTTVSMVSTVAPDNPAVRTYKLVRKPADGLSYAAAIAEKYGLTYDRLKGRIAS